MTQLVNAAVAPGTNLVAGAVQLLILAALLAVVVGVPYIAWMLTRRDRHKF